MNLNNKEIRGKYPEKSGEGNKDDSYRGYSIDLGHFDTDNTEDIVVSSPRGNNCKGYVEIFSSSLKLLHTIHGNQVNLKSMIILFLTFYSLIKILIIRLDHILVILS